MDIVLVNLPVLHRTKRFPSGVYTVQPISKDTSWKEVPGRNGKRIVGVTEQKLRTFLEEITKPSNKYGTHRSCSGLDVLYEQLTDSLT